MKNACAWARKLIRISLLVGIVGLTSCAQTNETAAPGGITAAQGNWSALIPDTSSTGNKQAMVVTIAGAKFLVPSACMPESVAGAGSEAPPVPVATNYACTLVPNGEGIDLGGTKGYEIVTASLNGNSLSVSRIPGNHFRINLRYPY